jgi:MoxR-like ATPase
MSFVAPEHIRLSLDYLADQTHPFLTSILALSRAGAPLTEDADQAIKYGGAQETALLAEFFAPAGAPPSSPFYVPFGVDQGKSRWRDSDYAGSSLQRQRRDRPDVMAQAPSDNKSWYFRSAMASVIKGDPKKYGPSPVNLTHLGVWLFRSHDISSLADLAGLVRNEFKIADELISEGIFSSEVPSELEAVALRDEPATPEEVFALLQPPPSAKSAETATLGWASLGESALAELDELRGADKAALQALSALRAGMHVVFTGPPGTGKTRLATILLERAGEQFSIAPATDQWTTFETIGGYFPSPSGEASNGEQLDFLPGVVVSAIEEGRSLVIDELNRADIDKAFGELFTLLAGAPITLPYRRRVGEAFKRQRIVWRAEAPDPDVHEIVVPAAWRIIGTMNDADKASLKRLSLAFIRRFAFVPLSVPARSDYEAIIDDSYTRYGSNDTLRILRNALVEIFADESGGLKSIGFAVGPAIPITMLKHAAAQVELAASQESEDLLEAVLGLYLAPQLQGRPELHTSVVSVVSAYLSPERLRSFEDTLAVWTGFAE